MKKRIIMIAGVCVLIVLVGVSGIAIKKYIEKNSAAENGKTNQSESVAKDRDMDNQEPEEDKGSDKEERAGNSDETSIVIPPSDTAAKSGNRSGLTVKEASDEEAADQKTPNQETTDTDVSDKDTPSGDGTTPSEKPEQDKPLSEWGPLF